MWQASWSYHHQLTRMISAEDSSCIENPSLRPGPKRSFVHQKNSYQMRRLSNVKDHATTSKGSIGWKAIALGVALLLPSLAMAQWAGRQGKTHRIGFLYFSVGLGVRASLIWVSCVFARGSTRDNLTLGLLLLLWTYKFLGGVVCIMHDYAPVPLLKLHATGLAHLVYYLNELDGKVRLRPLLPQWAVLCMALAQTVMIANMAVICVPGTTLATQLLLAFLSMIVLPHLTTLALGSPSAPTRALASSACAATPGDAAASGPTHSGSCNPGTAQPPAPAQQQQQRPSRVRRRPLAKALGLGTIQESEHPLAAPRRRPGQASLLDSAESMMASSSGAYQSQLGQPIQMCVKVNHVELEDVPHDLVKKLEQALVQQGVGAWMQMMDGAMRRGCVLITLHTLRLASGTQLGGAALGQRAAAMLLPVLRELLEECVPGGLPAGEHVRFQCADALISCFYTGRGAVEGWELHVENQAQMAALPGVQLGVVMAPSGADQPRLEAEPVPGAVQLHVQVWGLGCGLSLSNGWLPTPAGQHMPARQTSPMATEGDDQDAPEGPPLQLLARCQGAYLCTRVETLGCLGALTMASVTVSPPVPPATWATHHPGAEGSLLQPITLELWHGDRLLDVAYTLATPPASPTSGQAAGIIHGWWGTRPQVSAAGFREVQGLASRLWLEYAGLDMEVLAGHKSFMHDLCVWLKEVRYCAYASGQCVALGVAGVGLAPALTHAQRHALGVDLAAYARRVGLGAAATWITQQWHNTTSTHNDSHSIWLGAWTALLGINRQRVMQAVRNLSAAAFGYPCSLCEAGYCMWLRGHLASAQLFMAALMCVTVCAAFMRWLQDGGNWVYVVFLLPWLSQNLLIVMQHVQADRQGRPHTCSPAGAAAMLLRQIPKAAAALSIIPVPGMWVSRIRNPLLFLITHLPFSVPEQLQAVAFLPSAVVTALALAECFLTVAITKLVDNQSNIWWWLLGSIMCNVLVRLVLDGWLRGSGVWAGKRATPHASHQTIGAALGSSKQGMCGAPTVPPFKLDHVGKE